MLWCLINWEKILLEAVNIFPNNFEMGKVFPGKINLRVFLKYVIFKCIFFYGYMKLFSPMSSEISQLKTHWKILKLDAWKKGENRCEHFTVEDLNLKRILKYICCRWKRNVITFDQRANTLST